MNQPKKQVTAFIPNPNPLGYEFPYGKKGKCTICSAKKTTLVNDVCLDCSMPERKDKHH